MTPAERLAKLVLESSAAPYYVAGNETQRARAVAEAAKILAPALNEILTEHAEAVCTANPS